MKILGTNGTETIKKHVCFSDIHWEILRRKEAPVIPKSRELTETGNFVMKKSFDDEKIKYSFFLGSTGKNKVFTGFGLIKAFICQRSH